MDKFNRITVEKLFDLLGKQIAKGYKDKFIFCGEYYISNDYTEEIEEIDINFNGVHIQDILEEEENSFSFSEKINEINEINTLKDYINYILDFNIFEEITDELNKITNELTAGNLITFRNRCDEISKELDYKIYNLFNDYSNDDSSGKIKLMKKYLSYLLDIIYRYKYNDFKYIYKELLNLCKNLTLENMDETAKKANEISNEINIILKNRE
jgi:hypothetical protein